MNVFFKLISVRNAYNKLDKIIELSGLLLGDFFQPPTSDGEVSRAATLDNILGLCTQINTIKLGGPDILLGNEEIIKNALITVSKFEETINGLKIFNFVEENFPQYFNNIHIRGKEILINYDENTPLNSNKNLKIPLLGINFFSSKVKSVSSLYSTYNSVTTSEQQPARGSARNANVMRDKIRLQKTEFLNGYNEFINSCKFLVGEFKIQSFDAFIGIMGSKIDALTQFPAQEALVPVVPGAVVQSPTPDERKVADIMLNLSRALERIPEPAYTAAAEEQPHIGGNYEARYNQQGGSTPDENIRTILNDVKQLLLNLYNKCTNYIKNVQHDKEVLQKLGFSVTQKVLPSDFLIVPDRFIAFLNAISDIYETDEFCYQLLFKEADVEEENTIDNINIGFLTGLKLITDQYTYADLGYSELSQPVPLIEENISINFLLNNPLINLTSIKDLLFLLGWSNNNYLDLISTYFDEVKYGKNTVQINGGTMQLPLDESPPNILETNIPLTIKSIFSIIFFSIMEYLYYGAYGEKYKFNDEYIGSLITLSPEGKVTSTTTTYTLNVSSKINDSSNTYLTSTFLNYIKIIPNMMLSQMRFSPLKIKVQRVAQPLQLGNVGLGLSNPYGVTRRGGKQKTTIKKSKTRTNSKKRTNSKTRKMRKIKKRKFTKRIKKVIIISALVNKTIFIN
jgi:hypothetical protein